MTIRNAFLLASLPLALAGCTEDGPRSQPPVSPAARVVGAPAGCIDLNQIRETRVRDDRTIDFVGNGGRTWRNTLTSRCPGLRANNAITYETALPRLCSVDIVYVLEQTPEPHRGPACSLGPFVPVELRR